MSSTNTTPSFFHIRCFVGGILLSKYIQCKQVRIFFFIYNIWQTLELPKLLELQNINKKPDYETYLDISLLKQSYFTLNNYDWKSLNIYLLIIL